MQYITFCCLCLLILKNIKKIFIIILFGSSIQLMSTKYRKTLWSVLFYPETIMA